MDRLSPSTLQNAALDALRDGACRTLSDLDASLPYNRKKISNGIYVLVLDGLAERIEAGCYQLTEKGRAFAASGQRFGETRGSNAVVRRVRSSTFHQRLWAVIRMSGTFTVGDVVVAAARSERNPEHLARRYIAHLVAAGYVAELPGRVRGTRPGSAGFKRFRLLKNTGELAPAWRNAINAVHDYNTGEDIPCVRKV